MEITTFHVSPGGDDTAPGSAAAPFRTLSRARAAVRRTRAARPGPVTVLLRGGVYGMDRPLVLGERDRGDPGAPVTWAAWPGETPVLSGARPVTGWKPWKGDILVADVPEARDGYFTRQLFWRGQRMPRARWPKNDPADPRRTGWLLVEKAAYLEPADDDGGTMQADWRLLPHEDLTRAFHYRPGDLDRRYADPRRMEVVVSPMMGWFNLHLPIQSLDHERRLIALTKALPSYRRLPWTTDVVFGPGNRYYLANALEDLTRPGEWVLDTREGRVYFRPPEPMREGDVTLPVTPTLIELRMTEHIVVEGLTFTGTLDAGDDLHREGMTGYGAMFPYQGNTYCGETLRLCDSSHCVIRANRFLGCGANAIYVETDCLANRIERNEIAFSGANAVVLMGNDVRHPRNTRVTDNHIHHCGEILNYVAGVFLGSCDGTTVAHNHIHDMPHHAVNLATSGFGRNLVEYNHIHDVTLEINDTGAINCWMDEPGEGHPVLPRVARSGHVIRYNYIHDVQGMQVDAEGRVTTTEATRGIYLDDGSANCVVWGNVILRCYCGMLLHCGMHHYIENNLFLDCVVGINIGDGVSTRVGNEALNGYQRGHHLERNVFWTRKARPVLYTIHKYEEALLHLCDRNTLWSRDPYRIPWSARESPSVFTEIDLVAWRGHGHDRESLVGDPGFVDPDRDDFRLRPDSPLPAMGFHPIPWDRIGPRPRSDDPAG